MRIWTSEHTFKWVLIYQQSLCVVFHNFCKYFSSENFQRNVSSLICSFINFIFGKFKKKSICYQKTKIKCVKWFLLLTMNIFKERNFLFSLSDVILKDNHNLKHVLIGWLNIFWFHYFRKLNVDFHCFCGGRHSESLLCKVPICWINNTIIGLWIVQCSYVCVDIMY